MCFPDFIGPCLLDCRFAQGPDGKIPEQSEDDFFRPASPQGRLAAKDPAIQYLCRLKAENSAAFRHKKCRPFQACIPVPFRSFILRKAHRFGRCRPPAGWPGFLPVPGSRIFPPAPFPLLPAGLPSPLSVPYPQSSCRGWSRR